MGILCPGSMPASRRAVLVNEERTAPWVSAARPWSSVMDGSSPRLYSLMLADRGCCSWVGRSHLGLYRDRSEVSPPVVLLCGLAQWSGPVVLPCGLAQ